MDLKDLGALEAKKFVQNVGLRLDILIEYAYIEKFVEGTFNGLDDLGSDIFANQHPIMIELKDTRRAVKQFVTRIKRAKSKTRLLKESTRNTDPRYDKRILLERFNLIEDYPNILKWNSFYEQNKDEIMNRGEDKTRNSRARH